MSNQENRSTTDQILDLLLDALAERQKARRAGTASVASRSAPSPASAQSSVPPPRPEPPPAEARRTPEPPPAETRSPAGPAPAASRPTPLRPASPPPRPVPPGRPPREPEPGEEGWEPPPRLPSIQMGKMIGRLAILLVVLIVAMNIPVTRYGVSLARIMPESSSLIIRNGLVLKGSGPEIYILENDKLRWISSLDAFDHLGLTWADVHVVEDSFLTKFEIGRPIHVLLKCQGSDHIYRLENGQKRWIKDIDTFLAEGHVWDDVRFVSCQYLRDLPTGPSIPEDAGPAPEP